jgi:nucleoid-associated protein YgaU
MRGQTKIAVAISTVLIASGIWYIGAGDKQPDPTTIDQDTAAQGTIASGRPQADESEARISLREDRATGSTPRAIADAGASSSDVASPSPRRIDDRTSGWRAPGESSRPQPISTNEPVPAMTPTELPGERAGLTSVLPNTSTPTLGLDATSASDEVPPNADRDALPEVPILPPIAPVEITSGTPRTTETTPPPVSPAAGDLSRTTTPRTGDQPADKPAETTGPREHVVQSGDTFGAISLKYYGSVKYVNQLMKANPGKDPKRLYVGVKLVIPDLPDAKPAAAPAGTTDTARQTTAAARPAASTAGSRSTPEAFVVPPVDPARSYTVQPGEGWYDLARKFLGDGKNYPELYEYNKERVGGDPHLLRAGTVIELPPGARMPARSAPQPANP